MASSPISVLHPDTIAGAIMAKRKGAGGIDIQSTALKRPDEPDEEQDRYSQEGDESDDGLVACAQDFLSAIKSNDAQGLASAWRSAFEILESQPHEESEQPEESEDGEQI